MADSAVPITAGSGTSIDTRTEATNGNHRQVVVLGDPSTNAGVAPVDATNGLAVDVKVIAAGDNNIGNVDVVTLPALAAGTNNIGDVDVLTINGVAPAFGSGVRGATVQRVTIATDDVVPVTGTITAVTAITNALPAGTNNIGDVDILSIAAGDNNIGNVDIVTMPTVTVNAHAVTNAGTFAVQVDGNALTALQLIDDTVFTDDAAFTPATSKVTAVGYIADSTSTDVVDEGDVGAARMTLDRRVIVSPYEDSGNFVSGAITTAMTATTSTSLVAAAGAGLRNYITTIIVSNSHATVGTDVIIQDGSGGTTLLTIPAAALYGGAAITLPVPIRTTANTALFCANVTTGASTKVSAVGYKAP